MTPFEDGPPIFEDGPPIEIESILTAKTTMFVIGVSFKAMRTDMQEDLLVPERSPGTLLGTVAATAAEPDVMHVDQTFFDLYALAYLHAALVEYVASWAPEQRIRYQATYDQMILHARAHNVEVKRLKQEDGQ